MTLNAHPAQVNSILNIAQRRCEDLGITVRYDHWAHTAYTDGHNIVLPKIGLPITQSALDTLYHQIIHETGHHLRPDAFAILKAAKPPAHLCALYNIAEDDGMERERALEWRGDAKALSIGNDVLIQELNQAGQDPAPLACLALNQLSRLEWDTVSDVAAQRFIKAMPDHVKTLIAELESEGWVNKLRETKTPHDTWDVAVDLAKRLYPEEDQDEYEEIRETGHSMEGVRDDSDSSFDDAQSKQGQPDDSGTDATAQEDGQGMDGEDGDSTDGQGRTVNWDDCVVSEHSEWSADNKGGPLGITWHGRVKKGGAALAPTNLINVIDLSKSTRSTEQGGWYRNSTSKNYMPTDAHSRAFANKIRRYIQ